jgi:hypothetical protein
VQKESSVFNIYSRIRVDGEDRAQGIYELTPEVLNPAEAGAKLVVEGRPRNEGRLLLRNPVEPLREPCVAVERHGAWCEGRNGAVVQWDGVLLQAGEELCREADG